MKHLGDITKISGWLAPIVDTFIFGAPCQDLSVAGKRAGMKHTDMGDDETTRSGLYHEAIRIMKEMRERDARINGRTNQSVRPRYGVYENVPGAFSSNKGCDFQIVIQELIKIADPEAPDVPIPEKGWPTSGCIVGDTWSIAWRVMDAQYWGVPQRRRRICVIADFNGHNAPKIVFGELEHNGSSKRASREPSVGHLGEESRPKVQPITEGLPRNLDKSQSEREAVAGDAADGIGSDDRARAFGCDTYNYTVTGDKACTLNSNSCITSSRVGPTVAVPTAMGFPLGFRPENVRCYDEVATTLCNGTRPGFTTGVIQPVAFDTYNMDVAGDKTVTLRAGAEHNYAPVFQPVSIENHPADSRVDIDESGKVQTLTSRMGTLPPPVPMVMEPKTVCLECNGSRPSHKGEGYSESDTMYTLNTVDRHAVVYGISPYHSNCMKSDNPHSGFYEADTARTCGYPGCNQGGMAVVEPASFYPQMKAESQCFRQDGVNNTLVNGTNPGFQNAIVVPAVAHGVDCRNTTEYEEQTGSLQSSACHNTNSNNVVRVRHIVRRLTPLECERLQGFPDGWTDIGEWIDSNGKKHKEADSPRYKALGNMLVPGVTTRILIDPLGSNPPIVKTIVGSATIDTGVHMEIPEGCVGFIKSKSGLNVKHGLTAEGVIDAHYTGSVAVKLYNHTNEGYQFKAGDKIAQLVILKCELPVPELVDSMEETDRGDNGFGSTGR